jgi:hypothetical protein
MFSAAVISCTGFFGQLHGTEGAGGLNGRGRGWRNAASVSDGVGRLCGTSSKRVNGRSFLGCILFNLSVVIQGKAINDEERTNSELLMMVVWKTELFVCSERRC